MLKLASSRNVVMMTSLITMLVCVSSQHGVTARRRIGCPASVNGSAASSMSTDEPLAVDDIQSPKTSARTSPGPSTCQALGPMETV